MEYHSGNTLLQLGNILQRQVFAGVGAKLHLLQILQQGQRRDGFLHIFGGHVGEIQRGGANIAGLTQHQEGILHLHLGIGRLQRVDLLQSQVGLGQGQALHSGQIFQVFHQRIVVKAIGLQHQLRLVGVNRQFPEANLIVDITVREFLLQCLQPGIIGAVRSIDTLQLWQIFHHLQILIRQIGNLQLGCVAVHAAAKGNLPQNLALGQLLMQLIKIVRGNLLISQIQRFRIFGIEVLPHKDMGCAIPEVAAADSCRQQQQNHQTGNQSFHSLFRLRIVV